MCVVFRTFRGRVPINGAVLGDPFTDRLSSAIILGVPASKISGIFGISRPALRTGIAEYPAHLGYRDMFALSVLAAFGFTVSLLMAELALQDYPDSAGLAEAAVRGDVHGRIAGRFGATVAAWACPPSTA